MSMSTYPWDNNNPSFLPLTGHKLEIQTHRIKLCLSESSCRFVMPRYSAGLHRSTSSMFNYSTKNYRYTCRYREPVAGYSHLSLFSLVVCIIARCHYVSHSILRLYITYKASLNSRNQTGTKATNGQHMHLSSWIDPLSDQLQENGSKPPRSWTSAQLSSNKLTVFGITLWIGD
jgi:hypothetical protein